MRSLSMKYDEHFQEWLFTGEIQSQSEKDKEEANIGCKISGRMVILRYPTTDQDRNISRCL